MRDAQRRAASLFLTVALGCAPAEPGSDSASSTGSTSTPASASESGSVTSAAEGSASATDSAPTTSTGTPFTSDAISSTGEPCSFLTCDDAMQIMDECDNWAQDCPEGQKCAAYIAGGGSAWDALKCVEVTGTDEQGDPCTSEGAVSGVDSCIKGAMCWGVNQEGMGTCVALCTGSPEAPVCPPKSKCAVAAGGHLNLCRTFCDPLLQDCANPAEVCYPINDGFTCTPDASGDEGQANDPCVFVNVCDKGLMCADAAFVGAGCEPRSIGCCTPFCKFPGGACPNPDQSCVQYFDPAQFPANDPLLDIGVCGVPG